MQPLGTHLLYCLSFLHARPADHATWPLLQTTTPAAARQSEAPPSFPPAHQQQHSLSSTLFGWQLQMGQCWIFDACIGRLLLLQHGRGAASRQQLLTQHACACVSVIGWACTWLGMAPSSRYLQLRHRAAPMHSSSSNSMGRAVGSQAYLSTAAVPLHLVVLGSVLLLQAAAVAGRSRLLHACRQHSRKCTWNE